MALDLGKQVGPLPLGAWVVVVGGGLGIAWYTKSHSSTPDPSIDTSGQPGVGDGSVGGWVPTTPGATDGSGNSVSNTNPTTNEEWAYQAKQLLLGLGYPATTVSSAIDKYVNGITTSIQEYTLVGIALAKVGALPQTLPTGPAEPTDPTTPTTPTTDPSMPYPINQNLSKISKNAVTMTWGTYGRPSFILAYRNHNPGVPILPGAHSFTWGRLPAGSTQRLGIAYVKGTKVGPRHDITITLPR